MFSCQVMSVSLRPCELQHARPPCPSSSPWACSNSCPPSQWCHLILCCPLLLPSTFPSSKVFSNESALCLRWWKYWRFSFSISPSNEYSGLISFRTDWFNHLAVQGIIKSSPITIQKHQFFCALPSLWSESHIHTQLLKNLQIWLYEPLSAKWSLYFLICCLVLS